MNECDTRRSMRRHPSGARGRLFERRRPHPALPALLALACLQAASARAQFARLPELRSPCGEPNASRCLDEDWLGSACGQERENECVPYWESDAEAFSAPRELSEVPRSFSRDGIGYTHHDRRTQQTSVAGDPRSYSSNELARHTAARIFAFDPYPGYAANGIAARSCGEYVYEKYYGLTRYLRELGARRDDPRHAVDLAFTETPEDWAIGYRHQAVGMETTVAGYDGRAPSQGRMWSRGTPEFPVDSRPFRHGLFEPLPRRLLNALRLYHAGANAALAQIGALEEDEKRREQSWSEQRWLNETLSVEGNNADPRGTLRLVARGEAIDARSQLTSNVTPETPRRFLDDELNNWFERMQHARDLVEQWAALDEQYAGSGWTLDELERPDPGTTLTFARAASSAGRFSIGDRLATSPVSSAETASRRRIVDQLGALYAEAHVDGCFAGDQLGPCDWSPAFFLDRLTTRMQNLMDRDWTRCESFVARIGAHSLEGLGGRVVAYEPPASFSAEQREELRCRAEAPSSLSRASFEAFRRNALSCMGKRERGEALEATLEEALSALRSADRSAFFDEDGGLRPTHWETSATEELGGEYFGVGLAYDIAYGLELDGDHDPLSGEESFCKARPYVRSNQNIYARVLNHHQKLLNVDAYFDTREDVQRAAFSAEIFGHSYDQTTDWGEGGDLSWNLVDETFDWEKEQKLVDFTFWIGPVPVGIEAGLAGRVGVDLEMDAGLSFRGGPESCLQGTIGAEVRPFAGLSGYVFAGLDIWIAQVGVRGFLTIIELGLPLRSELILDVTAPGADLAVTLTSRSSLGVDFGILSGRLELFASAFGKDWSRTMVSWPGITWDREIFEHEYSVDLLTLHDAFAFAEGL